MPAMGMGGEAIAQLEAPAARIGREADIPKGIVVSYGYSRDCEMVYFRSADAGGGQSSGRIKLESVYTEKDCPSGGDLLNCEDREGERLRADAEVRMAPRQLYPWETESVDVCLKGKELTVSPWNVSYEYSVSRTDENGATVYTLTPGARKPSHPDPKGLSTQGYALSGGVYSVTFLDKWAREYSGEKVMIELQLWSKASLWRPAKLVGSVERTFDSAGEYVLSFSAADISGDPDEKEHYLSWGFRRIGSVSLPVFVRVREELKRIE